MIKEFQILGHTIKVKVVKKIPGKGMHLNRGLWVPEKNLIYIESNPTNIDLMEQTLYHEISHCILDNMGYTKLSSDEKFVDLLGSMLHQMIKTSR